MSRADEIIAYARDLKRQLHTKDPMVIANYYGIKISYRRFNPSVFKAQTIKLENYPTIISINEAFSPVSRKVLCAHELGHALMHEGVNHFDVTKKNAMINVEYEANLFAVALLFDEKDFALKFNQMSNATLKSILEYNINLS